MMRRQVAGVAVAGALLGLWISPGRAYADRIEPADRDVSRVRVTYVEPVGARALYVETNSGATYRFAPCTLEDGSAPTVSGVQRGGCYWDAGDRGNGVGRSFAVLPSGRIIFSRMIGDAR